MTRGLWLSAIAAALALTAPATASAGASMKIGVVDDGLMQRLPGRALPSATEWQAKGVDQSRLTLVWSLIAPAALSAKRPADFDARDPASSGYDWRSVDEAVTALRARRITVELALTTPAPIWASRVPSRREPTYRPNPSDFADFVHAAAVRYGARAASFTLINEPNLWQLSLIHI